MTSDTWYILAIFDKLSRYYNKEIKFEMLLRGCKTSPGYNAVIGAFSRAGKVGLGLANAGAEGVKRLPGVLDRIRRIRPVGDCSSHRVNPEPKVNDGTGMRLKV